MALFRKAGNVLRRAVSNNISEEISTSKPSIFQAIRCMSTSKLFIGGLSYSTDDAGLTEAFSKYGEVAEARVIVDRDSGRSRGFGFVTFSTVEEASAAIQALDQQDLHGRRIRVDYANDRTRGYGGGGFRSGNFGGGGGYGGNYGESYGTGGGSGYGGSYGTGGGYGGNYGSGGRTDAYAADGSSGADTHASDNNFGGGNPSYGGDGQNFGGSYASNNSYDGGNPGSGGHGQNIGIVGGVGGSENLFGGDNVGASSSSVSSGFDEGQDTFSSEESKSVGGADKGHGQHVPSEVDYRDDDNAVGSYGDRWK